MGSLRRKRRRRLPKSGLQHHKRSVWAISGVIAILMFVIVVHGGTLQARNQEYKLQEQELIAQIEDEKIRAEENKKLKDYIGTDEHIEKIAKEKLGLIHENEILFRSEH